MDLLLQLRQNKGTLSSALSKKLAAGVLAGDEELLRQALELVLHESDSVAAKSVRAGAAKIVELVAEKRPEWVAPYLESLAGALDLSEPQTRWMIIRAFGHCARLNPDVAQTAIDKADEFLKCGGGVCLRGAAAAYLGDIGALGRPQARRAFDILASAFPKASENEADWMIEAFLAMWDNLDDGSARKAVALSNRLTDAKKKSTQKRVRKIAARLGE